MAGSINKVILVGNLGKDPEIGARRTAGRSPICASPPRRSWRDKTSGEKRERTEWHSVVIFSEGLCRVAEKYVRKGSKVYLEGQLQTRKWQGQDGQDRYSTEVVLQNFNSQMVLLDRPNGGAGTAPRRPAGGRVSELLGGRQRRRRQVRQQARVRQEDGRRDSVLSRLCELDQRISAVFASSH